MVLGRIRRGLRRATRTITRTAGRVRTAVRRGAGRVRTAVRRGAGRVRARQTVTRAVGHRFSRARERLRAANRNFRNTVRRVVRQTRQEGRRVGSSLLNAVGRGRRIIQRTGGRIIRGGTAATRKFLGGAGRVIGGAGRRLINAGRTVAVTGARTVTRVVGGVVRIGGAVARRTVEGINRITQTVAGAGAAVAGVAGAAGAALADKVFRRPEPEPEPEPTIADTIQEIAENPAAAVEDVVTNPTRPRNLAIIGVVLVLLFVGFKKFKK